MDARSDDIRIKPVSGIIKAYILDRLSTHILKKGEIPIFQFLYFVLPFVLESDELVDKKIETLEGIKAVKVASDDYVEEVIGEYQRSGQIVGLFQRVMEESGLGFFSFQTSEKQLRKESEHG